MGGIWYLWYKFDKHQILICEQNEVIISDDNDDLLYYAAMSGSVYTYDLNDDTKVLRATILMLDAVLLKYLDMKMLMNMKMIYILMLMVNQIILNE